jgi:hypothetical protein
MRKHTHEVMDELSKLKDTYRAQCEIFVAEVGKLDKTIIEHADHLN